MRTFIALELPEEFSMQVAELARGLREQGLLQGRFMCRSTYHITLAFIGDVGEAEAQRVIDVLDEVRPKLSAIELRSVGLKKFGRGNTATIALELEPNDALLDAAAFVRSALDARGIAFDDKKFVPHITLARKAQVLTAPFLFRHRRMKLRFIAVIFQVREQRISHCIRLLGSDFFCKDWLFGCKDVTQRAFVMAT